jgi:hypothetical protein
VKQAEITGAAAAAFAAAKAAAAAVAAAKEAGRIFGRASRTLSKTRSTGTSLSRWTTCAAIVRRVMDGQPGHAVAYTSRQLNKILARSALQICAPLFTTRNKLLVLFLTFSTGNGTAVSLVTICKSNRG